MSVRPDETVPAPDSIASVLDELGFDASLLAKTLELFEADVANSKQANPTAVVDCFHRLPGVPVGLRQTGPPGRAVEQIGIDHPRAQMFERAGEGLLHLDRNGGAGIVGQTGVLSLLVCRNKSSRVTKPLWIIVAIACPTAASW